MLRNYLFHRVNPERDKLWDPMDVALFEKCIKYISKHYETDLIENILDRETPPQQKRNIATIMFDDGYKDNIEYAADILAKYKCKASFYVVTDCIEKNIPTWTNILENSFQKTQLKAIRMDFDFLPEEMKVKELASSEARIQYVSKLKPLLKKVSHTERKLALDRVEAAFHDIETPRIMMNWEDLNELKNAGHYIGSHTVSHPMLGTISDEEEIRHELQASAKVIEEKMGHFPVSISYPVGSYNERVKKLSQEAGYKIGLAVKQNLHHEDSEDKFEISRIELYNESWLKTRLRISNTLENIKSLIRYK